MLCLWKRFSQRVCNIQIRMNFANSNVTTIDVLPYHMIPSGYVLCCRVRPWILRIRNGTGVVTVEHHRVSHAWDHTQSDEELPQPDSFICHFRSSYILRLHCRLGGRSLFAAPPTHRASVHQEDVPSLRLLFIWVCVKACIGVTCYSELIFTSPVDQKHILRSFQIL